MLAGDQPSETPVAGVEQSAWCCPWCESGKVPLSTFDHQDVAVFRFCKSENAVKVNPLMCSACHGIGDLSDFKAPDAAHNISVEQLTAERDEARKLQFEWAESSDSYSKECASLREEVEALTKERDDAQVDARTQIVLVGHMEIARDHLRAELQSAKAVMEKAVLYINEGWAAQAVTMLRKALAGDKTPNEPDLP